jgi:heme/copper-type cytochrome/quinol oxidase subunit 2
MFDYSNLTVNFAVNVNSESTITQAPVSKLLIISLSLIGVVVVVLATLTTFYCIKRKKNQKKANAEKSSPLFDKEANEDNLSNNISNLS